MAWGPMTVPHKAISPRLSRTGLGGATYVDQASDLMALPPPSRCAGAMLNRSMPRPGRTKTISRNSMRGYRTE
jgi:hypothetical protein